MAQRHNSTGCFAQHRPMGFLYERKFITWYKISPDGSYTARLYAQWYKAYSPKKLGEEGQTALAAAVMTEEPK